MFSLAKSSLITLCQNALASLEPSLASHALTELEAKLDTFVPGQELHLALVLQSHLQALIHRRCRASPSEGDDCDDSDDAEYEEPQQCGHVWCSVCEYHSGKHSGDYEGLRVIQECKHCGVTQRLD